MIVTRIYGGLANQMFQYAAGRRLALHHNTQLKLDISTYHSPIKPYKLWPFELELCNIQATTTKLPLLGGLSGQSPLESRVGQAGAKLRGSKLKLLAEKHYHFDSSVLKAPDNTLLDGYWQSAKYFEDVADQIRQDLSFKAEPDDINRKFSQQITGVTAVSLHVRRGDYVSDASANQFHGTSPLVYYNAAVDHIASKIKDPHFFVFSDDPAWCKENLKTDYPTTYIEHNTGAKSFEDMRLMSQCQHHIIANSSFSWWGAWLNPSKDKIVIAPKKWFNDKDVDTSDLIPAEWTRL
jgi:hypothetical protein